MSRGGRAAGIVGAGVGAVAAAAAVGVGVERFLVQRYRRRADDPYQDEHFGQWHGDALSVTTDDGVALHVEIAEGDAPITVVLCHGFALNLHSWHFQREALSKVARVVLWDQRSHGRSARAPRQGLDLDRLGDDLADVLDAVAPEGPVVLIGHSMGGMTVLSLAARHPHLFATAKRPGRIVGVGLIATTSGRLTELIGLRGAPGQLAGRAAPVLLSALALQTEVVERARRLGADLAFRITKRYSYDSDVPPSLVQFASDLVAGTPIDVVAQFAPIFSRYDGTPGLQVIADLPVTIIGAEGDVVIPVMYSRAMAEQLPEAQYLELADSGHLVLLEHHEEVDTALLALVERAAELSASTAQRSRRRGRLGDRRAKDRR